MAPKETIVVELGSYSIKYGVRTSVHPLGEYKSNNLKSIYIDRTTPDSEYEQQVQQLWKDVLVSTMKLPFPDSLVVILYPCSIVERFMSTSLNTLFNLIRVGQVHCIPQSMLPILASGRIGGLEVDLGFSGTRVYPITAGVVDEFHSYCSNRGLEEFWRLEQNQMEGVVDINNMPIPSSWSKDITQRFNHFITHSSTSQPTIAFNLLSLLLELPSDCLKHIVSNIVLCGGGSEVAGIAETMQYSIQQTCYQNPKFARLHKVVTDHLRVTSGGRLMTWRGYCVFSQANLVYKMWNKEEWTASGRWTFE